MLWEACMGLLDSLYKQDYKYINALDALDMLAQHERCDISEIAKFLLANEYHKDSETYKKNYINQIEPCDDKAIGFISVDYWAVTKDILDKALENFIYKGNNFSELYEKSDYSEYFWLKEEFYNFVGFKKINFEINDDTYEKYLTFKKLAEYENKEIIEKKINQTDSGYTFYLFKKSLLSIHEAACILSGDEPHEVSRCENDTFFEQNFNDYLHAFNLIESAVIAQNLPKDDSQFYGIKNSDFKKFLSLEGITISGFNDKLSIKEPTYLEHSTSEITEKKIENLNAEIAHLRDLVAEKDLEIDELQKNNKAINQIIEMREFISESKKDAEIRKQQDKIEQLNKFNEQFSNEILYLKKRLSFVASLTVNSQISNQDQAITGNIKNESELTPEQEIPNSRQRNNVLKIISILSDMADLPSEPFTAFNMLEACANKEGKEIPSKHTVADWLKKARDSN